MTSENAAKAAVIAANTVETVEETARRIPVTKVAIIGTGVALVAVGGVLVYRKLRKANVTVETETANVSE